MITVGARKRAEHARVEAFYRGELGRQISFGPDEEVFTAEDEGAIVGACRLFPVAGTVVLRTVVVARDRRGGGIGRSLIRAAAGSLGPRACYCFPWPYLEHFYGEIGLRRIDDALVPDALRPYFGAQCIAMHRAGAEPHESGG